MNLISSVHTLAAAGSAEGAPLMLKIIFWLLLIFWAIGGFAWAGNPNWAARGNLVVVILFAILGFYTFGF